MKTAAVSEVSYDDLPIVVAKKLLLDAWSALQAGITPQHVETANVRVDQALANLMQTLDFNNNELFNKSKEIKQLLETLLGSDKTEDFAEIMRKIEKVISGENNFDYHSEYSKIELAIAYYKQKNGRINTELTTDTNWSVTTMRLAIADKTQQLGERLGGHRLLCLRAGDSPNGVDNELSHFLKEAEKYPHSVSGKTFHMAIYSYESPDEGVNEYGDIENSDGHWVYLGCKFNEDGKPISFLLFDYLKFDIKGHTRDLRNFVLDQVTQTFSKTPVFVFADKFYIQIDWVNCGIFTRNAMTALRKADIFTELNNHLTKIVENNNSLQAAYALTKNYNYRGIYFVGFQDVPSVTIRLLRGIQNPVVIHEISDPLKDQPIMTAKGHKANTTLRDIFDAKVKIADLVTAMGPKPLLINTFILDKRGKYTANTVKFIKDLSPEDIVKIEKSFDHLHLPGQSWARSSRQDNAPLAPDSIVPNSESQKKN